MCTGVLDYFPRAIAAVARLSKLGNDKHNPGEPLHWAMHKSTDEPDCIMRHLADRGIIDPDDGAAHDVKLAWRALANLERFILGGGVIFDEEIIAKNKAKLADKAAEIAKAVDSGPNCPDPNVYAPLVGDGPGAAR